MVRDQGPHLPYFPPPLPNGVDMANYAYYGVITSDGNCDCEGDGDGDGGAEMVTVVGGHGGGYGSRRLY
ncbi:Hypothetical predicted protein [Olea europaea subsp. europaea]|uniref:Uncharacterized protein n=1 Tax=Olea europaea subsp. europaea TaxID=158383 RepID=A0A8S0RX13_OLEEU|nr:Hypothetical predicted protein [Olea europaea subsp. europaea]